MYIISENILTTCLVYMSTECEFNCLVFYLYLQVLAMSLVVKVM